MIDRSEVEAIRVRLPGLKHQHWYATDVPTLLAALDEANAENGVLREVAAQCQRERNDMWHERDRALAAVRGAEAVRDELTGIRLPNAVVVDVARKLTELLADPEDGAS